jgi:hypothetical protein
MAKIEYKRLTRARSSGAFAVAVRSHTSLWLGADHLLFVNSTGYTETYKRFYFRDIQTFVVQNTQRATVVNIVLTILLVLLLSPALVVQNMGLKIFLFLISGVFGLFLLVNLLQGQTCRCFLRTAVQTEQLPPLDRIRRAQKVFARIRPLIATAQGGELSPETISEMMRQQPQPSVAGSTAGAENPEIPPLINS